MNKLDFSKDIILKTDRLILRKMTMDDAKDIFEYAKDENVAKWTVWDAHKSINDTIQFITHVLKSYEKNGFLCFVVDHKKDKKVIGTCGFNFFDIEEETGELGYAFSAKYWGKGYATEAARMVLGFGFKQFGLNKTEALCLPNNSRSKNVLKKIGLRFVQTLDASDSRNYYDSYIELYAILKNDFEKNK